MQSGPPSPVRAMSSSESAVSDVGLVQDLLREQTEEIQRLSGELDGKEQLVQAITARLEETVDQLDRLQRQGNSRGGGGGASASGIKEILDSQQAVAQRVDESLQYWEGTAGYFEQILERLNEIARSSTGPAAAPGPAPASGGSSYERMKANLLAGSPSSPAPSTAAPPSMPASPVAAATPTAAPTLPPLLMAAAASLESNSPPPFPVDTDLASREELVEAIQTRDAYIASLVQEARRRDDTIFHKIEWSKLASAPEDLRPQLVELSKRLREAVQREEHGQSMERARLAREQARIDLVKQQLEAQIRRLATPAGATPPPAPEPTTGKPAKDSWLNRLKR